MNNPKDIENINTTASASDRKRTICDTDEDRTVKGAAIVEQSGLPRPAACTDCRTIIEDDNVNTILITTSRKTAV